MVKQKNETSITPAADSLDVFDPNSNLPNEPPPSYDQAMSDPSLDPDGTASPKPPQPPSRPPVQPQRPPQQLPYSRPASASVPASASASAPASTTTFPEPTPINPNPYLPWRYSSTYRCTKCENMGYKLKKNGHPCKDCWKKFRPNVRPPRSLDELKYLRTHKQSPNPINSNVMKLPPGTTVRPMYPQSPAPYQPPVVVQPGDPRIGGVLCPRCNGRGMVHDFLNLITCHVCNGLGRVGTNGRPL